MKPNTSAGRRGARHPSALGALHSSGDRGARFRARVSLLLIALSAASRVSVARRTAGLNGKEAERARRGVAGIKVRVKAVRPRRTGETKGRGGREGVAHLKSTIEIQDPYAKSLARTGERRRERVSGSGGAAGGARREKGRGRQAVSRIADLAGRNSKQPILLRSPISMLGNVSDVSGSACVRVRIGILFLICSC